MNEEQEKELVWKKISEPYVPPAIYNNGNVMIGYTAGFATTGTRNVAIGYKAIAKDEK